MSNYSTKKAHFIEPLIYYFFLEYNTKPPKPKIKIPKMIATTEHCQGKEQRTTKLSI